MMLWRGIIFYDRETETGARRRVKASLYDRFFDLPIDKLISI